MDLLKSVYDISNDMLDLPTPMRIHTKINDAAVLELGEKMLAGGVVRFYDKEPQKFSEDDELKLIVRELVASSINYCYWYGSSFVRPNGSNSTMMYDLVDSSLQFFSPKDFDGHIDKLIEMLSFQRFPLLEERKRHLLELTENGNKGYDEDGKGITFARYVQSNRNNGDMIFDELVRNFQGFASDIFLKRASLFMIQLYRQLGWFHDFMKRLFVPADYQVPKMLKHFGCLEYSNVLDSKIQEGNLIEKGSVMECQLRAATILICRKLCKHTEWNIADVDTWLWTKRKEPQNAKFHLTVTSDY